MSIAEKLTPEQPNKSEIVKSELTRIAKRHKGSLSAEIVLEAATRASSPLHGYFQWDDDEAAREYRLEQARALIRLHKFVVADRETRNAPPIPVGRKLRSFLQVERGAPYRSRKEVLAHRASRKMLVTSALQELRSWCTRYGDLSELSAVRSEIAKALLAFGQK